MKATHVVVFLLALFLAATSSLGVIAANVSSDFGSCSYVLYPAKNCHEKDCESACGGKFKGGEGGCFSGGCCCTYPCGPHTPPSRT
ncbi:hypothetical protein ACP70R_026110 [Stipagrostis hirtigluma subsp. patula]